MLNLNDYFLFVQIVDHGGFAAASRALDVARSTLSDRMTALEADLGARLLSRTTRRVSLTDAGGAFYEQAVDVIRHAQAAETAVRSRASEPSGVVRFTAAVLAAQVALRPAIATFLRRYPKVSLHEHASDRVVDLFSESFDLAVRAHSGPLRDSRLTQRVLATLDWHLLASPTYLAEAPSIVEPRDLAAHPALVARRAGPTPTWRVNRPGGPVEEHAMAAPPRILSDSLIGLKTLALDGLGVTALPGYVARDDVARGALVRVLPDWTAGQSTISALLPESRGLLPSVRVFLDHLAVEVPKAVKA